MGNVEEVIAKQKVCMSVPSLLQGSDYAPVVSRTEWKMMADLLLEGTGSQLRTALWTAELTCKTNCVFFVVKALTLSSYNTFCW
jgi:hypothetical protein